MPKDIQKLADNMLIDPVTAKVAEEARAVDLIEQQIHFLKKANKLQALVNIIKGKSVEAVLIFAKTKFGADILVEDLAKAEISASAIHSNRTQGQRERAITEFRKGELKVLVATNIAARGIDVSHVTHVINYNLPEDPRNYIHRIGRTARAGRDGVAISLCVQNDLLLIKNIEKVIDQKIPVFKDHSFHHEFSQALQKTRAQKMKGFNGKRKGGRY